MSDKKEPRRDDDKKEIKQAQTKSAENNNESKEIKMKSDDVKIELNAKEEVSININEGTNNRESVRRKPILMVINHFFTRQPVHHHHSPNPYATEPPPSSRAPPINYKMNPRNDFIRLVLFLVLTMLTVTAGFISMALINESLNEFFHDISILVIFLPAMMLLMTVNYAFMCSPCANTFPCNIVMLALATIGMTLIATKISVHYGTDVVLYAVLATTGIVMVCIGLACTDFDFTRYMLYVVVISCAFGMVFMIVLLVKMVTGIWMAPVIIAFLAIGTLIQSVLLVIELQTVIGGGAVELTEEDYALGAYMIYTSIVDIFLRMVQIIGLSQD